MIMTFIAGVTVGVMITLGCVTWLVNRWTK